MTIKSVMQIPAYNICKVYYDPVYQTVAHGIYEDSSEMADPGPDLTQAQFTINDGSTDWTVLELL